MKHNILHNRQNCLMKLVTMVWYRHYCKNNHLEKLPKSTIKIFKNSKTKSITDSLKKSLQQKPISIAPNEGEYKQNTFNIQMISKNLHDQIFGNTSRPFTSNSVIQKHKEDLKKHSIDIHSADILADVRLRIPSLHGGNIEEHFRIIANQQVEPYKILLNTLLDCNPYHAPPSGWAFQVGWTQYDPGSNQHRVVEFPTEDDLVLDVEVCMSNGSAPTIATAMSSRHWYSWVSPHLFSKVKEGSTHTLGYQLSDLIPLGTKGPKLIVGHNVSYDRARLREQYYLEDTKARFIDTMSLHTCVSGITSYQRAVMKSKKEHAPEDTSWLENSSLNSLADVYRLYCGEALHSKKIRNVFVEGTMNDVRSDFHNLMTYCANDVVATAKVLRKLFPIFSERFPHPVTFAGMLELGSAYLPVNSNWLRYITESNLAYEDFNMEAKYHLTKRANESCRLLHNENYKNDLWLWNEDWSLQELKMKKKVKAKKSDEPIQNLDVSTNKSDQKAELCKKFKYLYETSALLPARRPFLPGYPAWYRKLCQKGRKEGNTNFEWSSGSIDIGIGMQITPKLLSMCWEGYPLYYNKEHGWGFLVPFRSDMLNQGKIPIQELAKRCLIQNSGDKAASPEQIENVLFSMNKELESRLLKKDFPLKSKKPNGPATYMGSGIWCNTILEESCYFFKLPHKNGPSFRVGNPLSKDFLNKFSDNVLSSGDYNDKSAERIIKIARMTSYWKNNRDRITGQMVVWLPLNQNYSTVRSESQIGAICPQVVVCGTLTRRAMEATWMTASNSQLERIGSELRAMIQAPKSYKIIGADVDSQELWIASVLGDAYSCGIHGATPLGWMTLSGSKSNGTDMHSVTAKAVGISRDHAKVINYARIYGAGQNFAQGLLKQFNPSLSDAETKSKAIKMFNITKGKKSYELRKEFVDQYENRSYSAYEAIKIAAMNNRSVDETFYKPSWKGGTESAMFNRLEEIALDNRPITPFLGCRLSRSLEGDERAGTKFLPTRVNWVVQSGAVDFLHLMLVSMRWLMGPHLRFCLSFHDEIRYLTKEEMAYKAALAMHVTNLLTRSFCSSRLGLKDLPMSVAFFSSVEVDSVLRKECKMDCKTPSNPHGLEIGYGISNGESLDIYKSIEKAGECDMSQWEWIK